MKFLKLDMNQIKADYAKLVEEAMSSYLLQDYQKSLSLWEEIIKRNNNCDLAYYKAGYCLYRLKDYKKAMEYFQLVNAKEAYSKARAKQVQLDLNENFEWIATAVIVVAVGAATAIIVRKRRNQEQTAG